MPDVLLMVLVLLVEELELEPPVPLEPLKTSIKATVSPLVVADTKLPASGAPLVAFVDIVLVGLLVDVDSDDVLEEPVPRLLLVLELEPVEELLGSVNAPDQFMPVKVDS